MDIMSFRLCIYSCVDSFIMSVWLSEAWQKPEPRKPFLKSKTLTVNLYFHWKIYFFVTVQTLRNHWQENLVTYIQGEFLASCVRNNRWATWRGQSSQLVTFKLLVWVPVEILGSLSGNSVFLHGKK